MVFSGRYYVFASEVASPGRVTDCHAHLKRSARPTVMVVVAVPFFSLIAGPGDGLVVG